MIVAQISDLHVKRRGHLLPHMPHVIGPLRRVLRAICNLPERPAFIVATGDLAESGHIDEYRRLRGILSEVDLPTYLIPGNHDRLDPFRQAFPELAYLRGRAGVLYTVEAAQLRLVALDSSAAPRCGGYLDAARLAWLDQALSERPDTATLLAMHHPPFFTGQRYFDEQAFEGRRQLRGIVRSHPQIRRIVCGHVHQVVARRWAGTIAMTAPSTAPSLVMRPRAVTFSVDAGGFLLHRVHANGNVSSHLMRVPSVDAIALGA